MGLWAKVKVPCPYALYERVKLDIEAAKGIIDDTEYGADVSISVSLPAANREGLQERLTELSAGGIAVELLSEEYRPGPREEV